MIAAERKVQLEPEYLFRRLDSMNCHYALVDERVCWLFTIQSYFSVLFRYLHRRQIITLDAVRCNVCRGRGKKSDLLAWSIISETEQPRANMQTTSRIVCISDRRLLRFASCEPEKKYSATVPACGASIFSSACKLDGRVYVGIFGTSRGTRLGLTGLKDGDEKQ